MFCEKELLTKGQTEQSIGIFNTLHTHTHTQKLNKYIKKNTLKSNNLNHVSGDPIQQ